MKQRIIEAGSNLLLFFINHWVVTAVAITLTGLFGYETPHLVLWLTFWLLPIYLYSARANVHNFYLFFFLQLLPLAIACNVRIELGVKFISLLMVIFYIVCSIKIRLSEIPAEIEFAPVLSVGVIGVSYIIEKHFIGLGWSRYYLFAILMYLIGYYFYYFISHYLSFVSVNKNSANNIPEQDIFASGMWQTAIFTTGGVGILLLSANIEWLSYLTGLLGKGLVGIIRFLVSLFPLEKNETNPMSSEQGMMGGMGGFLEGGETHPFWIILEKIATMLLFLAIVLLFIWAVVKGYQFLWNNFHKVHKRKFTEGQNSQDIRENCSMDITDSKTSSRFFAWNYAGKIRKLYRKYILKNKGVIVGEKNDGALSYLTARECCDKISADSLKIVYEKARYSNENVSAEDVKRARNVEKTNR